MTGAKHLEVLIKVCSSPQSEKIFNLVRSECGSLSIDLAFLVEAKNTLELPERLLACLRVHNLVLSKATVFPPPSAPAMASLPVSTNENGLNKYAHNVDMTCDDE